MKTVLSVILSAICFVLALFLVYALVLTVSAYIINPNIDYDTHSRYYRFLLNFTTLLTIYVARIKIQTIGLEKVPTNGRFLLVSNHRSKFDPILTWFVFRKNDIAFISKEENFHIPWFGRIIRKCCFMCIDREHPSVAIKTIDRAANLLKEDIVSVGVYPEGTRSKTYELLPFHNAVFKIAKKAEVPIVVITIQGAENVRKKFIRLRTDVTLKVENVYDTEWVKEHKTSEIGAAVREDMLKSVS